MKLLSFPATLLLATALASCSLLTQEAATPEAAQTEDTNASANKVEAEPLGPVTVPTEEQQQAAAAILREQPPAAEQQPDSTEAPPLSSDNAPAPAAEEAAETTTAPVADAPIPTPDEASALPPLPGGKLRMGSIIPQEDPASTGDAPPPTANSAERFGLRSPKIPGKLPMDIDGKLKSAQ